MLPFDPNKLYSLSAVGEVLALAPSSVHELVTREGLTRYRLSGRATRLSGDELVQVLERARARAREERGVAARKRAS